MGTPIAVQERARLAEVDAKLRRARPSDIRPPRRAPNKTLRERLRRPLLIVFPAILAVVGAAYYLAEEPYVYDRRCLRPRSEGIGQRPGWRPSG